MALPLISTDAVNSLRCAISLSLSLSLSLSRPNCLGSRRRGRGAVFALARQRRVFGDRGIKVDQVWLTPPPPHSPKHLSSFFWLYGYAYGNGQHRGTSKSHMSICIGSGSQHICTHCICTHACHYNTYTCIMYVLHAYIIHVLTHMKLTCIHIFLITVCTFVNTYIMHAYNTCMLSCSRLTYASMTTIGSH